MSDKPFELRVIPRGEQEYGIALYQQPVKSGGRNPGKTRPLVRIWGTPLRAIIEQVLDALKRSGYRAADLSRSRKAPFLLGEEVGVRLGLLMMAVKPLRKTDRMEEILERIRQMELEEAYYWFSKCTDTASGHRGQRSLRILLSSP